MNNVIRYTCSDRRSFELTLAEVDPFHQDVAHVPLKQVKRVTRGPGRVHDFDIAPWLWDHDYFSAWSFELDGEFAQPLPGRAY